MATPNSRDIIRGRDVPEEPIVGPSEDVRSAPRVDAVIQRPRVDTSFRHRVKVIER